MDAETLTSTALSRRSALETGAITAFLLSQATLFERLVLAPARPAFAATGFSDIQFDMGAFVHPAPIYDDGAGNVLVQVPVVFTLFQPARLARTPTRSDQATLAGALAIIEEEYPASPAGVLVFSVCYGLPYFGWLPRPVVAAHLPRLASDPSRFVLEEAVPFPADVVDGLVGGPNALIPGATKNRFNVNVAIESNDMLFQFRSDTLANLSDVALWLQGSNSLNGNRIPSPAFRGLFSFQPPRIQFMQPGLPRRVADQYGFEFAPRISPDSSMAMGFADRQVDASGPARIVTFAGNSPAKLTDAQPGDYFDNGSIAHFSHVIEDLYQFYALPGHGSRRPDGEPFTERCPSMLTADQPHIRMDGPGVDTMDVPAFQPFPGQATVPAGSNQFKLQFLIFVPAADFFARLRTCQAARDPRHQFPGNEDDDNGLERFRTATRRQNFLVPPRRHRAFPLLELC